MAKEKRLDRRVDYGLLSAFYGPLLTERQRTLVRLYCDEDYSLAEVAEQLGVTRQGVSDGLNRAFERLDEWELALNLQSKFDRQREVMLAVRDAIHLAMTKHPDLSMLSEAAQALDAHLRLEEG